MGSNNGNTIQQLTAMMVTMQETISNLTAQLEALKKPLEKDKEIPIMHHKDIEKPMKFNGNHWNTWHADFINFLNRKNHRWKRILQSILNNSKKPLDGMAYEKIKSDSEIVREEVLEVYKDQLYEYLKAFTSGDTNTLVISNGQAN